jgi:hypothetical protein
VSPGDAVRHRLSRAGDRTLNCCPHVTAITQVRQDTPGRAYYLRKRSTATPFTGAGPFRTPSAPPRANNVEHGGQTNRRPKALDKSTPDLARRMHMSDESVSTTAATLDVSHATV